MIQQKKGNDIEDRVYMDLVQAIPELPKMLAQMVSRIEYFDSKQPQTELAAIKDDLYSFTARLEKKQRLISRAFRKLLPRQVIQSMLLHSIDHIIRFTKQEAIADARYSLLLKLMHDADQKVPLISIIVFLRHGDPERSLPKQCKPVPHLEEARRSKGEARAMATLDALVKTAEGVYKPFLITLQQLSYLKEGVPPPKPVDFGDLVKVIVQRLAAYPGLIDPDIGWMRNSAAHLNYEYLVGQDAMRMWDNKHDAITVPVNELLDRVESTYQFSCWTVQRVGQLYLFRNFLRDTGLLGEVISHYPVLCSGNQEAVIQAEAEILGYCQILFTPMIDFFKSHGIR